MDLARFGQLMTKAMPGQYPPEWKAFLEFSWAFFHNRSISRPIVVELGTCRNNQKRFYEELLGARHIGIDISDSVAEPDILGNTHDPSTLEKLKSLLGNRKINLLFIDADHVYESVKKDFALYVPLVEHIVALHDIKTITHGVRLFWWSELMEDTSDWLKVIFYQYSIRKYQYGIGCLVKI